MVVCGFVYAWRHSGEGRESTVEEDWIFWHRSPGGD